MLVSGVDYRPWRPQSTTPAPAGRL